MDLLIEMKMKAKEFDAKFEAGEDMTEFLDFSTARRPNREKKKTFNDGFIDSKNIKTNKTC